MVVRLGFWVGNEYGTSVLALPFLLGTAGIFLDLSCLTGYRLDFKLEMSTVHRSAESLACSAVSVLAGFERCFVGGLPSFLQSLLRVTSRLL